MKEGKRWRKGKNVEMEKWARLRGGRSLVEKAAGRQRCSHQICHACGSSDARTISVRKDQNRLPWPLRYDSATSHVLMGPLSGRFETVAVGG